MASGQQFNLRWNNHTNNILQVFLEQLTSENLVDVTLSCQGQFLKAHKMILSACSPYFQELFRQHHVQHPVVILNGMKYSDIKLVVEFMYRGEIKVLETELDGLLVTAEALQVKGLSNVRNKYEKGDIQGAEQQQQPMQVEQQDVDDSTTTALSPDTQLRRKRRKLSDTVNGEHVGSLDPLESSTDNAAGGKRTVANAAANSNSDKALPFTQVAVNDFVDDDDLPATIKVEPPDIRDIDEEEPSGWESPKLVIDLPDAVSEQQPEANSVSQKPPRPNKATKVGSPSEYGKPRYLMEFPSAPGPSQDNVTLANELLTNQRDQRKQVNQWLRKRTGKIPRPPNAFMIFANEWRRKLAFQHPTESNKEISVRLGVMWKNLSSDTKESYYTASRQADEEHKRKYPGYYYSPKEARLRKNLNLMARRGPKKAVEAMHLVKVLMTDGKSHSPYVMLPESQQQIEKDVHLGKRRGARNMKPFLLSSEGATEASVIVDKDDEPHILEDEPKLSSNEVSPVKSETPEVMNDKDLSPGKETTEK
ncbi:uncharacterized protein [Anabrus simplex]